MAPTADTWGVPLEEVAAMFGVRSITSQEYDHLGLLNIL